MSEELSGALANLANQLGITTAQLWDWLQGNGVQAYARAKVAQLSVGVAVTLIGVALITIICVTLIKTDRKWRDDTNAQYDDDYLLFPYSGELLFLVAVLIFVAFILVVNSLPAIGELAGWIASPEGMVIQMVLGGAR